MDLISSLLADSMYLLYFANGLAFFSMGLAVALETRRSSGVKLAESLWLLCMYAFVGGLGNWLHMASLVERQVGHQGQAHLLEVTKALLLPVAAAFLLVFGARVVASVRPKHRWLGRVPWALSLLGLLAFAHVSLVVQGTATQWWQAAEVAGRAVLYFPGLLLASLGFALHARIFRGMQLEPAARHSAGAAAVFGLKALVSGLLPVPSPSSAFPSWSTGLLANVGGASVQILRTGTTLAIAYFIVRALGFLEAERRRQLETATAQRLQAQQDALEAQQRAHEATERWSRQLEDMVNTMAGAMSQPLGQKEMLHTALRKALDLAGFEAGSIWLVQEPGVEPTLAATSGLPETTGRYSARMLLGDGAGDGVVIRDLAQEAIQANSEGRQGDFRYLASVPVKCRGHALGIMHLLSRNERVVTAQEQAVLAAIGQQIAVAIENARLYGQVQNVAALEERGRLSRELHDGLAQVLGYLHLRIQEAEGLLSSGRVPDAAATLRDIQEVAREAYRDVRETILGLRTMLSPDRSLFATLNEYLRRFTEHSGIAVSLSASENAHIELDPAAEIQLLRIIQEALTNVRKHAHATRARVRFEIDGDDARITVADDGQGFDLSAIDQDHLPHLGLQTMAERAQSVGGTVQVESESGKGTRVLVSVPLHASGGDGHERSDPPAPSR